MLNPEFFNESFADHLVKKWQPVLEHEELEPIKGTYKKNIVAQMLENQENFSRTERQMASGQGLLSEAAPTNAMGASSSTAGAGSVDIFDPVLISLVRRSMPNLISYDVCGVQPMAGPTGLIFAIRPRYTNQTGKEALYNEANVGFSAIMAGNTAYVSANSELGTVYGTDPNAANYKFPGGMTTAIAESLGDAADNYFQEMAFSIEKVTVTAETRALKAEYSTELAQDLKAVHGLDAETELSNILSAEILAEINREVIRAINGTATAGAQLNTAAAGSFDLDVDSNGRWSVERFKGLMVQIDRDANQIAKSTRRGKGNVLICGSDVATALNAAGMLDYNPALSSNLQTDDTGNTFAGVLYGKIKVYIDPYFASAAGNEYYTIGYKGSSPYDNGLFYCPYVPLQMARAIGEQSFQPKIGFKTRYGLVANPFATTAGNGVVNSSNSNIYYRRVTVKNLM